MKNSMNELLGKVVKNDYCIGCGICAALKDSPLKMELDENGKYRPFFKEEKLNSVKNIDYMSVCPFSDRTINETEIGKELFEKYTDSFNEYTGYYFKNFAGYVKESNYRELGSSGGMGNWIAVQLIKNNYIDAIIHVKASQNNSTRLFKYDISCSIEEVKKHSKSKYYPVEMSEVINFVRENNKRFAIIGVPCFIKGIRLLARQDPIIKERIKFCIGLVCGHLKSDMFAKSIGWQLGVKPENLIEIDFRKKLLNSPANNYGVEVAGEKNGKRMNITSPTKDLYTTNWGYGFFKYNACEFCDDVLAETADVTVGDAWLPEYVKDSKGTNIVIVRSPIIQKIFDENSDKIHLEEISVDKIYQSQSGGFRHRRQGLSYRLFLKDLAGEWRPEKRVQPSNKLSNKRKRIYEKRTELSKKSFEAFHLSLEKNNFQYFIEKMDPLITDYNRVIKPSLVKRILSKTKRAMKKVIQK